MPSYRRGVYDQVASFGGGSLGDAYRYGADTLAPDAQRRSNRSRKLNDQFDSALADPTGTADLFGSYFKKAAEGYAAPALRDFQTSVGNVAANTAGRFGGNASTIEQDAVRGASNDFSRNLTEGLARLAPEQVAAGRAYTGQVGQAAEGATGQYDDMLNRLLALLQFRRSGEKGKSGLAGALGGIIGGVGGTLLGGPAGGAIGAQAGGRL